MRSARAFHDGFQETRSTGMFYALLCSILEPAFEVNLSHPPLQFHGSSRKHTKSRAPKAGNSFIETGSTATNKSDMRSLRPMKTEKVPFWKGGRRIGNVDAASVQNSRETLGSEFPSVGLRCFVFVVLVTVQ